MRKIIIATIFTMVAVVSLGFAIQIPTVQKVGEYPYALQKVYNGSVRDIAIGSVVVWDTSAMALGYYPSDTLALSVACTLSVDAPNVAGVVVGDTIESRTFGTIQMWGYCAIVQYNDISDTSYSANSYIGTSAKKTLISNGRTIDYGLAGAFRNDVIEATYTGDSITRPIGINLTGATTSGSNPTIKAFLRCW